jgi:hypothetical protein
MIHHDAPLYDRLEVLLVPAQGTGKGVPDPFPITEVVVFTSLVYLHRISDIIRNDQTHPKQK